MLHAVIKADPRVLRRIEWVEYHLTDDWPNPTHLVQTAADRFKLKELTWGEFLLRARVKVRDQDIPIEVSRIVNLMMKGPKI